MEQANDAVCHCNLSFRKLFLPERRVVFHNKVNAKEFGTETSLLVSLEWEHSFNNTNLREDEARWLMIFINLVTFFPSRLSYIFLTSIVVRRETKGITTIWSC